MNQVRKCILFLSFFLGIIFNGIAQDKRPKIGLVLSGGGAKGIAHIGVLKAMEEAGLTPDYISGTSMGSIVGGLYASGYTADELMEVVKNADWGLLLSNKIPFNQVTFEEKPYYGRYLFDFYLRGKQLQLPKGIIEGEGLMQLFSNLTRPVHSISDFSKLPIPFACVGSDIVTGEPVVLNKGSLAMAMRASMAIPSIFTPVKIDDHLLVDGGLVHNMPVREVIDMGADIVIGVFVSSDLVPEESLNSAISILSQSAFITSAFDSRQELAKCNILIEPKLDAFSTGSFNSSLEILESGIETGKEYIETFKKLADSLKQFGPLHKIVKPSIISEYQFEEIVVEGTNKIDKEFIIGKMQIEPGQSVSMEEIQYRFQLLYGTLYFEKLWFEIGGREEHQILIIHVKERDKTQLRFSFHYDSENKGGIVVNATLRNVLLNRSRLIFETDLSTFPRATVDYFKYLGRNQNLALEATGLYYNNELPSYDSIGNKNATYTTNYSSAGLKLQTTMFQNGAFGVEINSSQIGLVPKIVDSGLRYITRIRYNNTTFSVFHRFNNTNDRYFPTRGIQSEIKLSTTNKIAGSIEIGDSIKFNLNEFGGLLQTTSIGSVDVTFFPIIPLSSNLSLLLKSRMKLSNLGANTLNLTGYDFIGGFIPNWINSNEYYGSGAKEYIVANSFYGRLSVQYRIKKNVFLQGHFNYLTSDVNWIYEDAEKGRLGDRYNRYGYGTTLGFNSPIGPIAFSVAKDHYRKDWEASLIIGFYY